MVIDLVNMSVIHLNSPMIIITQKDIQKYPKKTQFKTIGTCVFYNDSWNWIKWQA